MSIAENLITAAEKQLKINDGRKKIKKAILGRGGEISLTAGLKDLPDAIFNIPADNSLSYYEDENIVYQKIVPNGAEEYALLKQLGGMAYKCRNLVNIQPFTIATSSSHANIDVNLVKGKTVTLSALIDATSAESQNFNLRLDYIVNGVTTHNSTNTVGAGSKEITKVTVAIPDDVEKVQLIRQIASVSKVGTAQVSNVMLAVGNDAIYEPYYEGLRDSKVTEIVSHGKNLLSDDVLKIDNWTYTGGNSAGSRYYLNLPNGWYCISHGITELPTNGMYFYLNKSEDGGKSYTSVKAGYSSSGYLGYGHFTTGNKTDNYSLWFKVDNESGIIYALWMSNLSEDKLSYIQNLQIEAVELEQEPSTSYPPGTHAPATEYTDYHEPITYPIPEAVQALEGYGMGCKLYESVNAAYNYIEWRNGRCYFVQNYKKIVLNGTENWKRSSTQSNSLGTRYDAAMSNYPPAGTLRVLCSHYSTVDANRVGVWVNAGASDVMLHARILDAFDTVEELKAHLAEQYANGTPVTFIYKMREPIETDISDILTIDNFLSVEGGGSLEFVNENKNAVPSTIAYIKGGEE